MRYVDIAPCGRLSWAVLERWPPSQPKRWLRQVHRSDLLKIEVLQLYEIYFVGHASPLCPSQLATDKTGDPFSGSLDSAVTTQVELPSDRDCLFEC